MEPKHPCADCPIHAKPPDDRPAIIREADARETGPRFLGLPDRWFEAPGPKWRCAAGHVSTMYLKSEKAGATCLGCLPAIEPVWLTFPEDFEPEWEATDPGAIFYCPKCHWQDRRDRCFTERGLLACPKCRIPGDLIRPPKPTKPSTA